MTHDEIRLAELAQLRTQLKALQRRCASTQATPDCGIITSLSSMPTTGRLRRATHLG